MLVNATLPVLLQGAGCDLLLGKILNIYILCTQQCPVPLDWQPRHGHASRIAGHPFIPVPRAAHVYSHGCGCRGWYLCIWYCLGRSPPTTMQIISYQSVQELVRIPNIGHWILDCIHYTKNASQHLRMHWRSYPPSLNVHTAVQTITDSLSSFLTLKHHAKVSWILCMPTVSVAGKALQYWEKSRWWTLCAAWPAWPDYSLLEHHILWSISAVMQIFCIDQ